MKTKWALWGFEFDISELLSILADAQTATWFLQDFFVLPVEELNINNLWTNSGFSSEFVRIFWNLHTSRVELRPPELA